MHANRLLKQNVDALLRARGQTRKDLAVWCRKTESWISKIMKEERREFPMHSLDRIADFFGLAAYQLLQPGLVPMTERRSGNPRRTIKDRRISAVRLSVDAPAMLSVSLEPEEVAAVQLRRLLESRDRQKVDELMQMLDPRKPRRRGTPPRESADANGG